MFRSPRIGYPRYHGVVTFEAGPHVYRKGDAVVPHNTGILDEWGFGFPVDEVDPEILAQVRDRGRYVHACSELIHNRNFDLEKAHPPWRGWCQGLARAYEQLALDALLIEFPLYEPQYDYATTIDFLGYAHRLGPRVYLVELKTGDVTGVDAQIGAQKKALESNYPDLKLPPENCLVLHLSRTGNYKLEAVDTATGFHDFAAMRRLTARRDRAGRKAA